MADHRRADLLQVEPGGELGDAGLVQVALGERVDPQLRQRHPPQPPSPLQAALRPAVTCHGLLTSFSWRANLASTRSDRASDAAHSPACPGSSPAGSASCTLIASPSRACTVSR